MFSMRAWAWPTSCTLPLSLSVRSLPFAVRTTTSSPMCARATWSASRSIRISPVAGGQAPAWGTRRLMRMLA